MPSDHPAPSRPPRATMRSVAMLLRIGPRNQLLFVACVVALAGCRLALSITGFRAIERWTPAGADRAAPDRLLARLGWLMPRAARLVPRATCLTQAAATRLLLASRGYASELRIGAAQSAAKGFEAHAWLVCEERIVVGGTEQELARFATFSGPRSRAS